MCLNDVTGPIIGSAIEVHRHLGPGLLEGIYEDCLALELRSAGLHVVQQCVLPVIHKGRPLDRVVRLDMVVDNQTVVELKSVDPLIAVA